MVIMESETLHFFGTSRDIPEQAFSFLFLSSIGNFRLVDLNIVLHLVVVLALESLHG